MFITLQPHSNTNDSDQFLVVDADGWQRFANGATTSYAIASQHDTFAEANAACATLNESAKGN